MVDSQCQQGTAVVVIVGAAAVVVDDFAGVHFAAPLGGVFNVGF